MNPLKNPWATVLVGVILAVGITLAMGASGNGLSLTIWLHVIVGITWIGLLYYFNFVQVPAVAAALADKEPGPAAINKYVAPRALLYFRWAAVATWLTGVSGLAQIGGGMDGIVNAFMLTGGMERIGVGAWLGTIMLFNVWVFIWPNQKKILGMVSAAPEEIAKAKVVALYASRTNTLLSIPMLMSMVGFGHGGFLPMG
ncbi:urate hydroxylase PuuD [endosymbiont of unidentified scaly snail isolate Monju]|uniref:urate hydroxylase PuuD n=1 Tax=endosymbiont of unidentified scaly snail isolate Monju TaxID=1248727 RepID=UPI000389291A|nr:urate hydroxylase PuuD [endosymbiont of unidentified scaly snail isolate Monju]BAN68472.1 conserved hypothetical protein [endosymbiont of unidentified scaly snail isolate Monju]